MLNIARIVRKFSESQKMSMINIQKTSYVCHVGLKSQDSDIKTEMVVCIDNLCQNYKGFIPNICPLGTITEIVGYI